MERHEAVLTFAAMYDAVAATLSEIGTWTDQSASDATGFLALMSRNKFVVAMMTLKHVMTTTKPLSVTLQKGEMELIRALKYVKELTGVLENWRSGSGSGRFEAVFQDASNLLGEVQMDQLPLGCRGRLANPDESAKAYYRRTIYNPFKDYLLSDLRAHFMSHNTKGIQTL